MSSAAQHPEVVTQYIQNELLADHLLAIGPTELAAQLGLHVSLLGVIPKKGRANQWRLIMDLSSPYGHSVNDGISSELCSLHWMMRSPK